ncbi:hypothetical protein QBC34DRAFT_422183 [Podospora aff. communis PSN243]|uniref:Uncharacterized protein n=1 Tax=Podospora aff. communis PSN243 TaxID=3040156 RepID=A0AAV9H217_9PEZI|nr:hypothetical protein QBC34DRAFT_422183 [Podospora aff. communis PSN243]
MVIYGFQLSGLSGSGMALQQPLSIRKWHSFLRYSHAPIDNSPPFSIPASSWPPSAPLKVTSGRLPFALGVCRSRRAEVHCFISPRLQVLCKPSDMSTMVLQIRDPSPRLAVDTAYRPAGIFCAIDNTPISASLLPLGLLGRPPIFLTAAIVEETQPLASPLPSALKTITVRPTTIGEPTETSRILVGNLPETIGTTRKFQSCISEDKASRSWNDAQKMSDIRSVRASPVGHGVPALGISVVG